MWPRTAYKGPWCAAQEVQGNIVKSSELSSEAFHPAYPGRLMILTKLASISPGCAPARNAWHSRKDPPPCMMSGWVSHHHALDLHRGPVAMVAAGPFLSHQMTIPAGTGSAVSCSGTWSGTLGN